MSRDVNPICSRISQRFPSSVIDNYRFVVYTITIYAISALYFNFVAFPLVNFRSWIATLTLGLFSFQVGFPRVLSPRYVRSGTIVDYRSVTRADVALYSPGGTSVHYWSSLNGFHRRSSTAIFITRSIFFSRLLLPLLSLALPLFLAIIDISYLRYFRWANFVKSPFFPFFLGKKQIFEMKQRKGCTVFNDRHLTCDEPKDPVASWPWCWKQQRI